MKISDNVAEGMMNLDRC